MKRILSLFFAALTILAHAETKQQNISQAIFSVFDEFQAVGISVAIVQNGQLVYNQSFGYKDLATATLLSNDDVMRIASISKSFTATALMQLVDRGIISLSDDVSDLIGFTIRNPHHPNTPITLRMLLSHTASIRDKEDYDTRKKYIYENPARWYYKSR